MQMKIETLTWDQVNAVWRSDEFCMLTNSQLAALHKRFEQLKRNRAWDEAQRVARFNNQLEELQQEKKRLQDAMWVNRGVLLRLKLVKVLKALKWLPVLAAGTFIAVWLLPTFMVAVAAMAGVLGAMVAFGVGWFLFAAACLYAIRAYLWVWKRFCRN